MKTDLARTIAGPLFLILAMAQVSSAGEAARPFETLFLPDGGKLNGRLKLEPGANPVFQAELAQTPTPLEPGMVLLFEKIPIDNLAGVPPFRVELGREQQLSGRLEALTADRLILVDPIDNDKIVLNRGGVQSLIQRPGEVQVFQDGFETLDQSRWTTVGETSVDADLKEAGERSLRLPASPASLVHQMENGFSSGRLDLAFHDTGEVAPGHQWGIDLTFKSKMGTQTLRVLLGWSEALYGVESPGETSLRVQRLSRKEGWHRLSIRFSAERSEIAIDGNELAYGKDVKGPLIEIRLSSTAEPKATPFEKLAARVDDLRFTRQDEPANGLEVDATQDEIRLTQGDQLFGKDLTATPDRVDFQLDGRAASLPWSDISGLHFQRSAAQGTEIEGVIARVEWQAASGDDDRDRNALEGAIQELSDTSLTIQSAYAGTFKIARNRLRLIRLIGNQWTHRIEIDSKGHHLGNEVSIVDPTIDPPQPEGGVLERSVDLAKLPGGRAYLVVDAVQVVGESPPELTFSSLVKKGELRTNLKINGTPFDYLNRLVTTRNESPERFRYPIPKDQLKLGKNLIRFEQVGKSSDPNYLDDLGLLGIAIEYD